MIFIDALRSHADALVEGVLDEMYENPFWLARYGARGRKFAREDGHFHIRYLIEALTSDNPGVMTRYALWLRTLLVSRGMCSAHVMDNFERLARGVAHLEGSELAQDYLRQAAAALRYDSPLEASLPESHLKSYLLDALHAQRPEIFTDYVRWHKKLVGEPDLASLRSSDPAAEKLVAEAL